jgi:hypothetical protein
VTSAASALSRLRHAVWPSRATTAAIVTPSPDNPEESVTDQAPEPAPVAAEGPITHVADWFRDHGGHAEAEAGHIAADISVALQDHAGTVFDVAGDGVALLKLIDPADAALASAAAAFLPKLLGMAGSAARVAAAALKSQAAS